MTLPGPTELTVWWRRQTPPGHLLCVTCASVDQASAVEEKHGVFGEPIGVTWGQRQLAYRDWKAEHMCRGKGGLARGRGVRRR